MAFNLEGGPDGEDVVTAEGEARIVADEPPASANPTYLAKYQRHARLLRVDARMVCRPLLRCDPHSADALAAVSARVADAQSSGAISSAARRAPSGSTGRYAIGRSSSSAIAAAMASGSDVR